MKACTQWKLAGKWVSGQKNAGQVFYTFSQRGTKLHGTAKLPPAEPTKAGFGHGKLTGTVTGTRVHYIVVWNRSSKDNTVHRGDYRGKVTEGKIVGSSYDLTNSDSTSTFNAHGHTSCLKR